MPVASRTDDFQKLLLHADSERNLHLPGSSEPLKANNWVEDMCISPSSHLKAPKESLGLPGAKVHS